MYFIDMHMHSSVSDGDSSPSVLAQTAFNAGLKAAAICDHDTGAGISEFMSECKKLGIEGIPSIEISVDFKSEMHILGYYVNYSSPEFEAMCETLREFRKHRNRITSSLLKKNGIDISAEEAESYASGDVCGRLHFAMAMTKKGYVKNISEAFSLYLGSGKCAFNKAQLYSPKEALEKLMSCGAYPVLAHPGLMGLDKDETFTVIKELKEYGLCGVECMHSTHDENYQEFIRQSASALSLKITGGSDYHGRNKPNVKIGRVWNDKKIPYEILAEFKKGLSINI